ncbi:hypothetical protein MTO96_006150 [Rhipicephalus appendiculatus]
MTDAAHGVRDSPDVRNTYRLMARENMPEACRGETYKPSKTFGNTAFDDVGATLTAPREARSLASKPLSGAGPDASVTTHPESGSAPPQTRRHDANTQASLYSAARALRAPRPNRRGTGPGGDGAPVFLPQKAAATSHVGAAAASARRHGNSPEAALSSSFFPTLPHLYVARVSFTE